MTLNKLVSGKGESVVDHDNPRARYSADGRHVYQGEKHIASCFIGDQGQPAHEIANRIADLLNADFIEFCKRVAQ